MHYNHQKDIFFKKTPILCTGALTQDESEKEDELFMIKLLNVANVAIKGKCFIMCFYLEKCQMEIYELVECYSNILDKTLAIPYTLVVDFFKKRIV